jgi:regulatory protein
MVITRIEPLPRRADQVRLHFANGRTMDVSRLVAEEDGLRPGSVLDDIKLARLRDRDLFEQTLNRALHFLESRPRSEREVRTRLAQKGTAPDLVDQVVERLRALGLIDDAAFAQFWVENRGRFNPRGARALKAELRQKGLAADLVAHVEDSVDEESGARDVALRYARRLAKLDRQTFRQKLWAQLARRGFDFDVIGPAIEEAWRVVGDERAGGED